MRDILPHRRRTALNFALIALFTARYATTDAAEPMRIGSSSVRSGGVRRISPFNENAKAVRKSKGASPFSLWAQQGDGKIHALYQNGIRPRRRITEGDIIHVIVDESSLATITANTDLKRRFEVDASLKDWIHFNGWDHLTSSSKKNQPGIDFKSERRMQGRGSRDRRDRMIFKIAATVAWDLGDGTLFITAKKVKRIHDEESILTLSGYIRREDVDSHRTIRSENIHDLNLSYTGSGSLTSNYTRSIWGWLLDLIWF